MRRIAIVALMFGVLAVVAFLLMAPRDATWKATPADAIYDNPANWSSGSVPDGTAIFGASAQSDITFSRKRIARYSYPNNFSWDLEGWISAGGWDFDPSAGRYQFTIRAASYPVDPTPRVPCTGDRVRFTGAGIVIRGGGVSIINDSCLAFVSRSTAGAASITNNKWLAFHDGATAGNATILNDDVTRFLDADAARAAITNNFELAFRGRSSAADSAIVNNGRVWFLEKSTGGNATINNAAPNAIVLFDRVPASLGAIAGGGKLHLDKARLSIGANNQSTTFSGEISDTESQNEKEAALIKVGVATLTLAGTSSYIGQTRVTRGVLAVDGSIATSRLTTVERGGTLSGKGTVGPTQVEAGGILAPGSGKTSEVLTIAGNLGFQPDATYTLHIDASMASSTRATGDVSANGATIQIVFAPGVYVERRYKILEAGGNLVGRFAPVTTVNPPVNLKATLSYEGNAVYLLLSADG